MIPTVTFILPVYNGLPYIRDAVESVLNQTDDNWKLVLVNDASRDASSEYLESLDDSRISVIFNRRNLGLYGSLARVIPQIDSQWISVLMQDDRLKSGYLGVMRDLCVRYPKCGAVWATEDVIDESGEVVMSGRVSGREEYIEPGSRPWEGALRRGCFWTISGSFTRRDVFIAEPFRTDLPHCGDYDWLLRAIRRWPFVFCERSLAQLRRHPGQASAMNLALGRDIEEQYAIVRAHYARFPSDLSISSAIGIAMSRAAKTARRLPRVLLRGRVATALLLLSYTSRFLVVPRVRLQTTSKGHAVRPVDDMSDVSDDIFCDDGAEMKSAGAMAHEASTSSGN